MYEVEVKVRADHGPVRERLEELGAESLGRVHQRDVYFDHPGRSFAETDEALRLRRESRADAAGGRDGSDLRGDRATDDRAADEQLAEDRATNERAILTYKGARIGDGAKTRAEVETALDDGEATETILGAIGFEPAATVEKDRERYALEGFTVALDRVAGLGEFVEVEAEGSAEQVDDLGRGAMGLGRQLGLDPDAVVDASYLELLLAAD